MNKFFSIISLVAIVLIILIFSNGSKTDKAGKTDSTGQSAQTVEIKDGIQYITILAKGGYSPRITEATAGIPTKLIVQTKDTYDCSSALTIRSIKYQEILPQNGETIIDLGTPVTGEPLLGVCSMGMYSFQIKFS